jgi:regulator of protease activity HflC (stomatin/prohibitin superfamily)
MFEGFIFILLLFTLIVGYMGVKIIPQGYEYTVERFGRFTRVLEPGLHFITPMVDRVGQRVNVMEQVLDIPTQQVITKDNAQVSVDGLVFFTITSTPKAAYEVNDLGRALRGLSMTSIRSVLGEMDLDDALSNRDTINSKLLRIIDSAAEPWGTSIQRVEIQDISPPLDLVEAMARQMKAERDKRAQILEAEGDRESSIKRAEGEKASQILEAEGRLEAARRDAEARERLASAEAEATKEVSEAVASGRLTTLSHRNILMLLENSRIPPIKK